MGTKFIATRGEHGGCQTQGELVASSADDILLDHRPSPACRPNMLRPSIAAAGPTPTTCRNAAPSTIGKDIDNQARATKRPARWPRYLERGAFHVWA